MSPLGVSSENNPVDPKGTAVSPPRVPSARPEVLTAGIRAAKIRAERGRQIVARRQVAVTYASEAGATVIKPAVEVGVVVGAPPKALSLITHRVKRRCQALVESDASSKQR